MKMNCEHRVASNREEGFSLIEMIIAIALVAILSAALVPVVFHQMDAQRHQATFTEMEAVNEVIVGNPSYDSYGYIGDMGGLPNALADLNANPGGTTHSVGTNGVPIGWNGPYLNIGTIPNDILFDAWGNAYAYNNATGQITSGGLNQAIGDADDIIVPPGPIIPTGTISVIVTTDSLTNPGSLETLDNTEAIVAVLFSNNGIETPFATTYSGSSFDATGASIHRGLHAVVANGIGAYAGRTGINNVVVNQGVSTVNVYIK